MSYETCYPKCLRPVTDYTLEAQSIVDVDFEFFDPNPKVDYTALKRLLQQLFHIDAALFQLHELADLILSQPLLGTTIKTGGIESDPLAFLTVLNLHVHKVRPSLYLKVFIDRARAGPPFGPCACPISASENITRCCVYFHAAIITTEWKFPGGTRYR